MNKDIARRACQLSADAYQEPPGAKVLRDGTAKVILAREDDFVWVSVEGTKPKFWDWIKNLWTVQTDFFGLQVHSGCAHEANALLPLIEAELLPTDIIRITGHSQGGGVAALLAWALVAQYTILSGHAFAPMRSISKKSCGAFNITFKGRWWNFARQSDVVPHVPPALRYRRPGMDYFFNENEQWVTGVPSPVMYLYEVWRLARKGKIPEMWADHDIDKYVEDMERL